jgi:predicted ATPase
MKISKFQIKNYKSWKDSGELIFNRGLNIIVGQNNAGKTALLEALTLRKGHKPHASLKSKLTVDQPLHSNSDFEVTFQLSANEFKNMFLNSTGQEQVIYVPAHASNVGPEEIVERINQILESSDEHVISAIFENSSLKSVAFEDRWYGPSKHYMACRINRAKNNIELHAPKLIESQDVRNQNIEMSLGSRLPEKIFFFHAERFNLGKSTVHHNKILNSNCDNLPQVLNYLQTENPARFKKFNDLVSKVFPHIKQVTVPPLQQDAQILIWLHDVDSQRSDLAVPISESGTGVGQVLAMLYVIINSERPQVLLIDEPQSFLHPGAVRSLIEIFKMRSEHQYILTTHAPAIISMATSPVIQVTHDGFESTAKQISADSSTETRLILEDLGAKLSDIFGADKILWVEGVTEENCFKLIVGHFKKEPFWGMQIIGVKSTGDLQGKHAKHTYDIYTKLSSSSGLIPPAVGFIFDSEKHSDDDKQDLKRKGKGQVHFIERRMYENYLLDPDAIAFVSNNIENFSVKEITSADIKEYIKTHEKTESFTAKWYEEVDGPELLSKIFTHFSETRVRYEKVKHGSLLTRRILETNPSDLKEIYELIESVAG